MTPLLLALPQEKGSPAGLASRLGIERGELEVRHFPDGESLVRLVSPVARRDVVLFCGLDRPDEKILPLLFAADAAREQGAASVGLVAPYLAYMRQDKAFRPGEAITSLAFSRLVSAVFDWLATVEPHLHRFPALDALYSIPAEAVSAAAPIAGWVRAHVASPFILGPDAESQPWVSRIAALAGAPSAVLSKCREGDYEVVIDAAGLVIPPGSTPVIVDDIASSASTLIETVALLKQAGHAPPCCVVVHALFAGDAYARLAAAGPAAIVSTNTVLHESNAIDVSAELGAAIATLVGGLRGHCGP